jgi:hypothetical protein
MLSTFVIIESINSVATASTASHAIHTPGITRHHHDLQAYQPTRAPNPARWISQYHRLLMQTAYHRPIIEHDARQLAMSQADNAG